LTIALPTQGFSEGLAVTSPRVIAMVAASIAVTRFFAIAQRILNLSADLCEFAHKYCFFRLKSRILSGPFASTRVQLSLFDADLPACTLAGTAFQPL